MKDSATRRAWVKNVAIIFLVILLLLTFFSRTILNYSLPEVSAQYAQYATLTTAVKTQGTVKANESYNVVFEENEADGGTVQSRKVISVYVKEGDTVEKDAPILALSGGPSTQLEATRKDYEEKKKAYELALIDSGIEDMNSEKSVADKKREIEKAEDKLAELKDEYKEALAGGDPVKSIKNAIDRLKDRIKDYQAQIKTINAQSKDTAATKKTVNKQIEDVDKQIADVQKLLSEAESKRDEAERKQNEAESQIEEDILSTLTVSQKLAVAQDEYYTAETAYYNLKSQAESKKAEADRLAGIVEAISANEGDINKANDLTNQIKGLQEQLESAEKEARRAREDYYDTLAEYEKSRDKKLETLLEDYLNNDHSLAQQIEDLEKQAHSGGQTGNGQENEGADNGESTDVNSVADNTDKQEEIDSLSAQRDALKFTYNKQYDEIWEEYNDQVDALTKSYDRATEDRDASIESLNRQIADAQAKLYVIDMPEVDDVINYEFGYDLGEAQNALAKAKEAQTQAETDFQTAEQVYEKAKSTLESLKKQSAAEGVAAEYQNTYYYYKNQADGYQSRIDALNQQKKAYEDRLDAIDDKVDTYTDQVSDINDLITDLNEQITDKQTELSEAESGKGRDPEEIDKDIQAQEDTIRELKEDFEILEASEGRKNTETDQQLEAQKKEIEALEKKIEEYENAPENTSVLAPIGGRIVSVNFVPGDTVTSGNTVASIEIADKGYVVEISMSAEEARRIQVGSPCTVTNSWWYSNITASVAQVRSDPKSQGKNRIIVINVSGDVSEGQSLNFSIGDRSQSYDSVLPNSALRSDNDGTFVLTVEAKKTPLGNRYVAKRTNVEILASDDTQSAVSGLYGSEFVITSATTPITDGQQVRLAGD
ncbi:MAG: HlyD family efflux transporter periplasmic adaptor subunit [Clostridiales bacterium]|nr:HlyD family efflux transporter periplasmic adaptor subunit [Clostridiales bacterium]